MSDRDDAAVSAGEAEAQSEETIMPWIWGAIGVLLIAVFVAWVLVAAPRGVAPPHAGVAPAIFKPPGQGY